MGLSNGKQAISLSASPVLDNGKSITLWSERPGFESWFPPLLEMHNIDKYLSLTPTFFNSKGKNSTGCCQNQMSGALGSRPRLVWGGG